MERSYVDHWPGLYSSSLPTSTSRLNHAGPKRVGDKYYAPDVGLVLDVARKGGKERFELVSITMQ
jgi:hypothetical protein